MSKVKKDSAGRLFVVVNGGVYRPQAGPWESPHPGRNWGKGITTSFKEGDAVRVRHLRQSVLCTVTDQESERQEFWTCHGYDTRSPEKCFGSPDQGK